MGTGKLGKNWSLMKGMEGSEPSGRQPGRLRVIPAKPRNRERGQVGAGQGELRPPRIRGVGRCRGGDRRHNHG